MKSIINVSLLLTLLLSTTARAQSAEATSESDELRRLRKRVEKLEGELESMRKEFAALHAVLRKSAENLSRPKAAANKKLDIKVIEGGWGQATLPDIRAVCLSAAGEIWKHFPDQTIEPISIRHSGEGPMVVYGRGSDGECRVLLDVDGKYWAQFSFQFAHEFCHILCNYRKADNPNLWFEESLCETASLYAMRRMAESWKTNPPYSNWKSFADSLGNYAQKRLDDTDELNGVSLAKWYDQHRTTLRKKGTDRAKNQIVAVAMLPLFEKSPQDWPAVRYLNRWDKNQNLTLEAYLADWYRRVPSKHKAFVANIARLFEIELGEDDTESK